MCLKRGPQEVQFDSTPQNFDFLKSTRNQFYMSTMDQTLILRIICHAAICWTSFLTILNSGRSIVLKSTTPRSWKSRQKREKVIDIMASILYVGGKIACHPGLRASTHHASSRPLCSPNSPADLGRHSVLCGMVV